MYSTDKKLLNYDTMIYGKTEHDANVWRKKGLFEEKKSDFVTVFNLINWFKKIKLHILLLICVFFFSGPDNKRGKGCSTKKNTAIWSSKKSFGKNFVATELEEEGGG